ncbi:MAG: PorP/SprF family type IX secretion system membrane protein [Saprospiraceae bacterium]
MKHFLLFLVLVLVGGNSAMAQLQPLFSQPSESYMLLNPAYIPADNLIRDYAWFGGFTYRNQWIKMDGAPQSALVRVNYVDTDDRYAPSNVSIGGYMLYDKIGDLETYAISGKFAYNMDLTNNHYLSAGLAFSVNEMRLSNKILTNNNSNANDPMIGAITTPNWGFDFSAGLFYHYVMSSNNRFFASASAISIANLPLSSDNLLSAPVPWHIYGGIGVLFGDENAFEVSVSGRMTEAVLSSSIETFSMFSLRSRYQLEEKCWFGLSVSNNYTAEAEAGVFLYRSLSGQATDRDIRLSMSFMHPLSNLSYYFGNTFEFNLTFLMR